MAVRFDDRPTLSRVARIPFSLVRPRARPAVSQYRRVGSVSGSANDSPGVEYPFVEEWCRQHVLSLGQPSPPIAATTDDRRRLPAAKGLQINPIGAPRLLSTTKVVAVPIGGSGAYKRCARVP